MADNRRKRAKAGTPYWIIWNSGGSRYVQRVIETNHRFDDEKFQQGNYFIDPRIARAILAEEREERYSERQRKNYLEQKLNNPTTNNQLNG